MIETLSPRALIRRPRAAVVMPLPTDETTPPVTKMYCVIARSAPPPKPAQKEIQEGRRRWCAASGSSFFACPWLSMDSFARWFAFRIQNHETHRLGQIGCLQGQLVLGRGHGNAQRLAKWLEPGQLFIANRGGVLHRDDHFRFELTDHFGRLLGRDHI